MYSSTLVMSARSSPQEQVRRLQNFYLVQLSAGTGNYMSVSGQARDVTTTILVECVSIRTHIKKLGIPCQRALHLLTYINNFVGNNASSNDQDHSEFTVKLSP
jgi:hypothetical protein